MSPHLKKIHGEPSWTLRSDRVELAVTQQGGHLGPVFFDRKRQRIQPFHIAPFATQKLRPKLPLLKILRGDFFCLPFGGNSKPFRGEKHPPHGETANKKWKFLSQNFSDDTHELTLELPLRIRRGHVTKRILLRNGEDVVYQEHIVRGMSGPNCPGHHPTLEFRSQGHIAVSPFLFGSTYPWLMEKPEDRTYCGLKTGFKFRSLGKAPLIYGGKSDLSVYPNRKGFMDVIQIIANPKLSIAWNTVTFPKEGWLYFALRDPKILRQTVFWFSNGGRYSPPWLGQNLNVLGIEDVTCYFGEGLPLSTQKNPWAKQGILTALSFNPLQSTSIRYIMGIAPTPRGFTVVKDIRFEEDRIIFLGDQGSAHAKVDWEFLKNQNSL